MAHFGSRPNDWTSNGAITTPPLAGIDGANLPSNPSNQPHYDQNYQNQAKNAPESGPTVRAVGVISATAAEYEK